MMVMTTMTTMMTTMMMMFIMITIMMKINKLKILSDEVATSVLLAAITFPSIHTR